MKNCNYVIIPPQKSLEPQFIVFFDMHGIFNCDMSVQEICTYLNGHHGKHMTSADLLNYCFNNSGRFLLMHELGVSCPDYKNEEKYTEAFNKCYNKCKNYNMNLFKLSKLLY